MALPLSVFYQAFIFVIWVALFEVLEKIVLALFRGQGFAAGLDAVASTGREEMFAECLITFLAFVPYFAFKELQKEIGSERMRILLFGKRVAKA